MLRTRRGGSTKRNGFLLSQVISGGLIKGFQYEIKLAGCAQEGPKPRALQQDQLIEIQLQHVSWRRLIEDGFKGPSIWMRQLSAAANLLRILMVIFVYGWAKAHRQGGEMVDFYR